MGEQAVGGTGRGAGPPSLSPGTHGGAQLSAWLPLPPPGTDPEALRAAVESVLDDVAQLRDLGVLHRMGAESARLAGDQVRYAADDRGAAAYDDAACRIVDTLVDAFGLWDEYAAATQAAEGAGS